MTILQSSPLVIALRSAARPLNHAHTRACCALVSALLLVIAIGATDSAWAQTSDVFTVRNVAVDAKAASAAEARATALATGKREAFTRLFRRLTRSQDYAKMPTISGHTLEDLIDSFEIGNERVSSVRYRANLTVDFKDQEVRDLLRSRNVSFAETRGQPTLVVPVFDLGTGPIVWGEPGNWRDAWLNRQTGAGLIPLVLPLGDIVDIGLLSDQDAATAAPQTLLALADRYGTADVAVATALLNLPREPLEADPLSDPAAPVDGAFLTIGLRHLENGSETTFSEGLRAQRGETLAQLLGRGTDRIVARLEDEWKEANLLRFDQQNAVRALVPLNKLAEWVEVRKDLAKVSVVVGVDLAALSRKAADVRLRYLGEPDQLERALEGAGLSLTDQGQYWLLERRPVSVETQKSDF